MTGMKAHTAEQFQELTLWYTLQKTGILINFGITIGLGFIIGVLVSGQLLYNFVLDNTRYFGTLKAMGTPNRVIVRMVMLQAALFVATFLIVSIPAVRRTLTPRGFKRDRGIRQAEEQFLSKNLKATRERTGVLIFVSEWERMAELIADEGVASRVDPGIWDEAMSQLIAGVKAGRAVEGFEAAVEICGGVLSEHFPPRDGDNPNELPDHVVVIR
jgi:uncharacterized membrane protein